MKRKPDRLAPLRAFTLIELLTVIAIIGILAAILIPVAGRVRDQARAAVCASNLREVGTGIHMYAADNDDRLPPVSRSGSAFTTYWMDNGRNLGALLVQGYVDDDQIFFCPGRNVDTEEALAYDAPVNIASDGRTRLRSSFPARFIEGTATEWSLTGHIQRPTKGDIEVINAVIYSDFVGVKNYASGGITSGRIGAVHQDRGFNRLYGGGAVRWTAPGPLTRQIGSGDPGGAILMRLYEELDHL